MYIIIFIILSQFLLTQDCTEINKKAIYMQLEKSIEYQKMYYNQCKEDCGFIRLLVDTFSKASEDNFGFLNERDIEKAIECDIKTYKKKSPAGLREGIIIYYLRKNKINNLFEIYKEEEIMQHISSYIYYKHIRHNINLGCEIINTQSKDFHSSTIFDALLLYECGYKDKAKELARKNCETEMEYYKRYSKNNNRRILQITICKKIMSWQDFEIDEDTFLKAKHNLEYLYKLYGY